MQLGYVRVSTTAQDLARQYAALREHGIADELIWSDKKTGANTDRPGLAALLAYARSGDVLVTHTLDRLGRNLRDCLNLVHELRERGVGIKTLADPLAIDTTGTSAMAQVAVAMLSLFSEIERVFARERAAHARTVREASGAQVGRRKVLTGEARDVALAAVASGQSVRAVARSHGVGKDTLYRALAEQRAANEPESEPAVPGEAATATTPIEASSGGEVAPDEQPAAPAAPVGSEPAAQSQRVERRGQVGQPGQVDAEPRRVGAREPLDVNAAGLARNPEAGAYRVTAPTIDTGETVLVGWLSRDPRRSGRWQAALIALLEPHYRSQT